MQVFVSLQLESPTTLVTLQSRNPRPARLSRVLRQKLAKRPSLTMSWTMYTPATLTRNVGRTAVGFTRTAPLPGGTETRLHENVSGSPSASLDALPSSITSVPTGTVWSGPALATGREFAVLMTTTSGALSTVPSLTTNWTT